MADPIRCRANTADRAEPDGTCWSIAADPAGHGYWLAAADGGMFSFGGAPFLRSLGATHLDRPIFAITSTPGVATVSSTAR